MLDIIVGGQAGDEGKAKVIAYLAKIGNYAGGIRIGGSQAGHSIVYEGEKLGLKAVPACVQNKDMNLYVGAGSYIVLDYLLDELEKTGAHDRFKIDGNAVIVTKEQTAEERANARLMGKIGSVGTGVGPAVRDRIMRTDSVLFAKDVACLEKYVADVASEINKGIAEGKHYLLEGTQGFVLSNIHGQYPFCTSRDSTASTFVAEAGCGPKSVRDIYLVLKPYTTRVGPGPLEKEIFDEAFLEKLHTAGGEKGSVSKRPRRAGEFEWENVKKAVMINSATKLAVTHIDMIDGNEHIDNIHEMIPEAHAFIAELKRELGAIYPHPKLAMISYGPKTEEMIVLPDTD
jgi:adenylosuccinate synthase